MIQIWNRWLERYSLNIAYEWYRTQRYRTLVILVPIYLYDNVSLIILPVIKQLIIICEHCNKQSHFCYPVLIAWIQS